jgi:hypothetical protein
MKIKLSVTELREILKLIPQEPEEALKMAREDATKAVGEYLSSFIRLELEAFLGPKPYKRRG